jgi:hypothetical protein
MNQASTGEFPKSSDEAALIPKETCEMHKVYSGKNYSRVFNCIWA